MDTSFLFDIDRKDVFVGGKKVPDRQAIINKDTNEVIGIVGTRYVPLLNKDLLEHCIEILDKSKMPFVVYRSRDSCQSGCALMELPYRIISAMN